MLEPHSPSNSVHVPTDIFFGLNIVLYSVVTGYRRSQISLIPNTVESEDPPPRGSGGKRR